MLGEIIQEAVSNIQNRDIAMYKLLLNYIYCKLRMWMKLVRLGATCIRSCCLLSGVQLWRLRYMERSRRSSNWLASILPKVSWRNRSSSSSSTLHFSPSFSQVQVSEPWCDGEQFTSTLESHVITCNHRRRRNIPFTGPVGSTMCRNLQQDLRRCKSVSGINRNDWGRIHPGKPHAILPSKLCLWEQSETYDGT